MIRYEKAPDGFRHKDSSLTHRPGIPVNHKGHFLTDEHENLSNVGWFRPACTFRAVLSYGALMSPASLA
jgi:hypothetical protein